MIKINILFKMTDNPTGGGNQFLKNLKKWLIIHGYYSNVEDADVIIFNSHQYIEEIVKLKKKYVNKLFIHRVAGPIKIQTYRGDRRDSIVHVANKYLADATVFQSNFSMKENIKWNMPRNKFEKIISNAADVDIFHSIEKKGLGVPGKIRLVATSWSNNMNKGFPIYEYLDRNLDFDKYEMTFIGNSPIEFHNINVISPLDSWHLAEELRQRDIYITASKNEACSNALIEALSCGLPAVCLNSGSNPEILKKGGLLFNGTEELCKTIDEVAEHYDEYRNKIQVYAMDEVALRYVNLSEQLVDKMRAGIYIPKKIGRCEEYKIKAVICYAKLCSQLKNYMMQFKSR